MAWNKNGESEKNTNWKGDKVSYRGLHAWVVRHWGAPKECEHCDDLEAKVYDWSNKTGDYSRDRDNWQRLCRSCHQKYDYSHGMRRTRNAS